LGFFNVTVHIQYAVTAANRRTLISSIVDFVKEQGVDGVDFDWEYPGAPDIPGIPSASTDDGTNYFLFLNQLRNALDQEVPGTLVSIAAPSSFWYLQNIPIQAISLVTDYIIFMTYDLHGQWDDGHSSSQPGCPAGNCLRSDVNLTETMNSLSMITKAGVPSSQVVVGVTSYGRSFEMSTPGCYTEMCTYTASGANPGPCTNTSGYLGNAEIAYAQTNGNNVQSIMDSSSYVDILVWDDTQWVSYMSDENKLVRSALYGVLNLGGTTDWAVDLQGDASTIESQCKSLEQSNEDGFPTCIPANTDTGCIAGTGSGYYQDLCEFSCQYDYCPEPFCTCTANGTVKAQPTKTNVAVCPATSLDSSYKSLCTFDCSFGYCPDKYCVQVESDSGFIGLVSCDNEPYTISLETKPVDLQATCVEICKRIILSRFYDRVLCLLVSTTCLLEAKKNYVIDSDNPAY
jgi:hypothetical protein